MDRLQILLFIQFLTGHASSEVATTPMLETAGADALLLRLQKPYLPCYLQYGPPTNKLADFNPSLSTADYSNGPLCVCEKWWPETNPTQLLIYGADMNLCNAEVETVECSDDQQATCSAHLWIGNQRTNPQTTLFRTAAMLKCTKESSVQASSSPKYFVKAENIDDFDVGNRCDGETIIDMLNYRQELYRSGSQFFGQIPILNSSTEFNAFCDPTLLVDGAGLIIKYKCIDYMPDFTDTNRHQKPLARDPLSTAVASEFSCYKQAGEPLSELQLQGLYSMPTKDNPVCVCEDKAVLKRSIDGCGDSIPDLAVQGHTCAKTGAEECEIEIGLFDTKKISVFCNKVTDSKSLAENLGTAYFPNYVAIVKEAYIYHKGWDLLDALVLKDTNDFDDQEQMEACPYNEVLEPEPKFESVSGVEKVDRRLFDNKYTAWENKRAAAVDRIKLAYKNWINSRTQYKHYNSDIHLHVTFDVSKFLDVFCPSLREENIRKKIYSIWPEEEHFKVVINVVCEHQTPYVR